MDPAKMITRLNSLEAAANLLLSEVHKAKKELSDTNPPKAVKGWTDEKRAIMRARRMRIMLKS